MTVVIETKRQRNNFLEFCLLLVSDPSYKLRLRNGCASRLGYPLSIKGHTGNRSMNRHKQVKDEITLLAESCTGGQFCEMNYTFWVGRMDLFLEGETISDCLKCQFKSEKRFSQTLLSFGTGHELLSSLRAFLKPLTLFLVPMLCCSFFNLQTSCRSS